MKEIKLGSEMKINGYSGKVLFVGYYLDGTISVKLKLLSGCEYMTCIEPDGERVHVGG